MNLWRYLRQHAWLILLLLACAAIFATVLALYHLPLEPVLYASALCLVLVLFVLAVRLVRFVRAHRARQRVLRAPQLLLEEMPPPATLAERDDAAIMAALDQALRTSQFQLSNLQQDASDYFTAWVHQIKTPLAVMRLQLQNEDTAENRALLAELFQMEQYVGMALSYARLNQATKDLVFRRTPLDDLLRQTIREFAPLLIRRKIALKYTPTKEIILTDSKWLLFLFEQLLSNAVKYTESGTISIRVEPGSVVVIEDTGIGIAPEDVPRVFEKGYTGYNGRSGKKATGLGLYLVHQAAEMLNYRVSLTSQVGVGTQVRVDLRQQEIGKE